MAAACGWPSWWGWTTRRNANHAAGSICRTAKRMCWAKAANAAARPRAAVLALQRWLTQRPILAQHGEPALFVSLRGTRLSDGQLRLRLAQRAQAAGLPTAVHPHMLRHSYASHLLQSSGDLRAVQELLGHAQIATTQVYTKLDFQHLAQVYDAAHPRAKKR